MLCGWRLLVNFSEMLCESGCFFRQTGGVGRDAGAHGRRVALGAAGGAWHEGVCVRRHFLGRGARATGRPAGVPCSEGPLQVERVALVRVSPPLVWWLVRFFKNKCGLDAALLPFIT